MVIDMTFGASPRTCSGEPIGFRFGYTTYYKGQHVAVRMKGERRFTTYRVGNIPSASAVVFEISAQRRTLIQLSDIAEIKEA